MGDTWSYSPGFLKRTVTGVKVDGASDGGTTARSQDRFGDPAYRRLRGAGCRERCCVPTPSSNPAARVLRFEVQLLSELFLDICQVLVGILEYFPDRGWAVVKHVSGENRSPKEMVIALVGESITWQDELDDLAEAAVTGSLDDHLANSELRDLFES